MSSINGTPEPENRPEHFYKYRGFTRDCDKKRLLHMIGASEIYYSSPASFNDPFDCKVPPVESFDAAFIRHLIAARSAKTDEDHHRVYWTFEAPGSLTCAEREALHSDLSLEEQHQFNVMLDEIQQQVNASGVISFSANNDNTLMWAHYADSHRGMCLMFSLKNWPQVRPSLYPVTYRIKRPSLTLNRQAFESGHLYHAVILTKYQQWCYEQEWRVLGKACGLFAFPPEALVGIIFGCNMPNDDRACFKSAVEGKSHIALYETKIKTNDFGIDIVPY